MFTTGRGKFGSISNSAFVPFAWFGRQQKCVAPRALEPARETSKIDVVDLASVVSEPVLQQRPCEASLTVLYP